MKVIAINWLSPGSTAGFLRRPGDEETDPVIGIVVCEDEHTHKRRAFIGVGRGQDLQVDTQHIVDRGGSLHRATLEIIAAQLIDEGE